MTPRAATWIAAAAIAALAAGAASGEAVPIDQVPQYGGMDRSADPVLRAGDEQFIEGTTKAFGSREKASAAFSLRGRILYQEDKNDQAMRRFNQAWLLDPNNFEAYWGFGMVLFDQKKHSQAVKWFEKAHSLNPEHPEVRGDLVLAHAAAAMDPALSAGAKQASFDKSNELFERFRSDNKEHPYLYYTYARALAIQERFALALEMLEKYKSLGGRIRNDALENGLRQRVK